MEDCVSCLEECLYFLKDKTPWEVKYRKHFLSTSKNYLEKITKSKYKCKVNIQLCAILSQLNRHESALIHAKKAYEKAKHAVIYCGEICKDHMALHRRILGCSKTKVQSNQYKLLESPHYSYFTNLVQFAIPVISGLQKNFDSGEIPDKKSHLTTYIAEWLTGFQIGDMMIIDYLDFTELKTRTGIDDEISTDLLLEKICFLTISSYCIGTEIRMLASQKFSRHTMTEAKAHYLASSRFSEFLPPSSLLYNHIQLTISKYFGKEIEDKKIKLKEVSQEKIRKKRKSPEIEKIYKPKSLKLLKRVSPVKKAKNLNLVKPPSQSTTRKEGAHEVLVRDRNILEQFNGKNEPDPETNFE